MNLKPILDTINSLKSEIDLFRPLDPILEKKIMQKFRFDWNYHSNNIEGNQLSYCETKSFLLHGITAKGKPLKDHLDIKGHNEALLMLDDIVKKKHNITEKFIRELHIICLHESYYSRAQTSDGKQIIKKIEIGKYKSQPNHVLTRTGEMHYFASPEETPAKMNDLILWYKTVLNDKSIHAVIIAAIFHYKFISIHPFDDGNGRVARILMNLILMQNGYPPIVIKTEAKGDYYKALQEADGGNEDEFIKYIGEQLIYSLDLYLKGAKGVNIEDIDDIDRKIDSLKTSLSDNNTTIKLNTKILIELHNKIISPLFELLFAKLSKFEELFDEKEILYKYADNKIAKSQINNLTTQSSEHVKCNSLIDLFTKILDSFKESEKTKNLPSQIEINYNLNGFNKNNLKFNVLTNITLKFNELEYFTILSNNNTFKRINVMYKDVELVEDEKLLIINSIASSIINQITERIKH